MRFAVDIETECKKPDCPGGATCQAEKHAIDPKTARITCIGVYSTEYHCVFRSLSEFKEWLERLKPDIIGHNFAFDAKHLYFNGVDVRPYWKDDTLLLAHICNEKIPADWLTTYEERRKVLNKQLPTGISHRQASQYSLKTLAPYFLKVDAFWEDPTNHNDDAYVLKDCAYTLRLYNYFRNILSEAELLFYREASGPC